MRIVIAEFMEELAVASLRRRFDVLHDAGLAENRDALVATLDAADALIVRNRTRVDAELLSFAPRSTYSRTSRCSRDLCSWAAPG